VEVTSTYSKAQVTAEALTKVSAFLKRIKATAEQWTQAARWRLILSAAFPYFLCGKVLGSTGRLVAGYRLTAVFWADCWNGLIGGSFAEAAVGQQALKMERDHVDLLGIVEPILGPQFSISNLLRHGLHSICSRTRFSRRRRKIYPPLQRKGAQTVPTKTIKVPAPLRAHRWAKRLAQTDRPNPTGAMQFPVTRPELRSRP
jgi:hypothetical protein